MAEIERNKNMKLFRIKLTAFKTFYVTARNQEQALLHQRVEEEGSSSGEIDWNPNDTSAEELSDKQAYRIINQPQETKKILRPY